MKFDLKISNAPFWIFLALLLTGIFFWQQVYSNYDKNQPLLGHFVTDSNEYYNSIENLLNTGSYFPDVRMPGLGIIFLLLRSVFSKTITLNIILVLQWLLTGISAYILALTISRISKKENVFYYIFFLITATHYVFSWNNFYLTEGCCIPFFIFSLYYLNSFLITGSKQHLFLAGFFLTWCVFMRPVFFLFLGIVSFYLLFHFIKRKVGFMKIVTYAVLFLGLFIILDSIWIYRNYRVKNKFVFLNDIGGYTVLDPKAPYSTIYAFMGSWGGDLQNQMFWFEPELNTDYSNKDTTLPSYIYTSKFNGDSLILVKERMKGFSRTRNDSLLILANNSLRNFMYSIQEEKPILYHIGAPLIYVKKLIFGGYGTFTASDKKHQGLTGFKKAGKMGIALLFYFLFFLGMIKALFILFSKGKYALLKVLTVIALVNVFFICFYFRIPEFRYLLTTTLIFFCFAGIALEEIWQKIKRRSTSA